MRTLFICRFNDSTAESEDRITCDKWSMNVINRKRIHTSDQDIFKEFNGCLNENTKKLHTFVCSSTMWEGINFHVNKDLLRISRDDIGRGCFCFVDFNLRPSYLRRESKLISYGFRSIFHKHCNQIVVNSFIIVYTKYHGMATETMVHSLKIWCDYLSKSPTQNYKCKLDLCTYICLEAFVKQ